MENKFEEVLDYRWLKRYLKFIEAFKRDTIYKSHNHHILPKKLYPEYENFSDNTWNLAILGYREHLVAHYMLAKALGGNMWFAYNNMNAYGEKLNSILYESAMVEYQKVNSLKKIGTVCAKNIITDEISIVSQEEFDKDDNLVGVSKGMFVGDKNVSRREETKQKISEQIKGRIHCIHKESNVRMFIKEKDFSDEYEKVAPIDNNGFTAVKTENGIKRITSEEFKNGDYEHFNKGKVRTQEQKDNMSKNLKGHKKKNTENYNKIRCLISPDGIEREFLGAKSLKEFCESNNLSLTILTKNKNSIITELTKANRPKLIETSRNTLGWKLVSNG